MRDDIQAFMLDLVSLLHADPDELQLRLQEMKPRELARCYELTSAAINMLECILGAMEQTV